MAVETKELEAVAEQEVETIENGNQPRARRTYVPRADIFETDEAVVIIVDVPGVNEASVDITVDKNVLSIDGPVAWEKPDDYNLVYAEYKAGDYRRSFTLSNEIDQDNIEASVKNGVLRLHLPKVSSSVKKISVVAA